MTLLNCHGTKRWLALNIVILAYCQADEKGTSGKKRYVAEFASISYSRISLASLNYGILLGNVQQYKSAGVQASVSPGFMSSNIQFGLGKYFDGGPCVPPAGLSADLVFGRTYWKETLFPVDGFYFGLQAKFDFIAFPIRLGVFESAKGKTGFNFEFGLGR